MDDHEALFQKSFDRFNSFPGNLVYRNTYDHVLKAQADRLDEKEDRLFCIAENTEVELWEYEVQSTGFEAFKPKDHGQLRSHITGVKLFDQVDPQCRFMFVHAGHSRDKLKVTRTMLTVMLTYHQAMAPFVEFLFSFGKQDHPRDFHFSGLYHQSRLTADQPSLDLPKLGRSGKSFQLCYNLKSVESSPSRVIESSAGQVKFPWSVRLLAVQHSFDVITGKTFWTIIKGNQLIKERVKAFTAPDAHPDLDISSPPESFSLTLAIQLIIFDWCCEKWRWYISDLEELQDLTTRRAITTSFDRPSAQNSNIAPTRAATEPPGKLKRTFTGITNEINRLKRRAASATGTLTPSPQSFPLPELPPQEFEPDLKPTEIFSISDLQKVQSYEEKIKELLLVIKSNIKIVSDVKQYYLDLVACPDFPVEIKQRSLRKLRDFENRVTSIVNDLEMQHSRADMLLSTLIDRKELLNGILDYRNMEASKRFAEKAEASTTELQALTYEMNTLAQKTKQETVSMRIITLVTLFYLPGTFVSTIMSTDILKYSKIGGTNEYQEEYSSQALERYVTVTLPLIAATFMTWYIVYLWVDKKQNVQAIKEKFDRMLHNGPASRV